MNRLYYDEFDFYFINNFVVIGLILTSLWVLKVGTSPSTNQKNIPLDLTFNKSHLERIKIAIVLHLIVVWYGTKIDFMRFWRFRCASCYLRVYWVCFVFFIVWRFDFSQLATLTIRVLIEFWEGQIFIWCWIAITAWIILEIKKRTYLKGMSLAIRLFWRWFGLFFGN